MVTLQQRLDNASELRAKGYNCAQCVAMCFNPELEAAAAGFGAGVSNTGNICGCAAAIAMITSMRKYTAPAGKRELYAQVHTLLDKFAEMNNGDINCRDLRQPNRKSCSELIKDAVTILHEAD